MDDMDDEIEIPSPKSRLVAFLLCFFFGWLGAHRFYLGKNATGIVWMLTLGAFVIGSIYDLVTILCGVSEDKEGRTVSDWKA